MAATADLYIWPGQEGLPSASPFCMKVILALRYKRVPYRLLEMKAGAPAWARRGRMPAMILGDQRLEDSTTILKALDLHAPGGGRLYPFARGARAETLLLEDWADEWLSVPFIYERWAVKKNYRRFVAPILQHAPKLLGPFIASRVRKGMIALLEDREIALQSEGERADVWPNAFFIVEEKLNGRPFLTGEQPTAADFAVYPFFKLMMAYEMQPWADKLQENAVIMAWMKSVENSTPLPTEGKT